MRLLLAFIAIVWLLILFHVCLLGQSRLQTNVPESLQAYSFTDEQQISAILKDVVQGVRQGNAMRISQHCSPRTKAFEIKTTLDAAINQGKGINTSTVSIFDLDSIKIKVASDTATVNCLINDGKEEKTTINLQLRKKHGFWHFNNADNLVQKLEKFIRTHGIVSRHLRTLGATNISLVKESVNPRLAKTASITTGVTPIESQHMFIPYLYYTDPKKWSITEADAIALTNKTLFTGIDDFEQAKFLNGDGSTADEVLFCFDKVRNRIVYSSDNGNWIKSYGDWPGQYEFNYAGAMKVVQFSDGTANIFIPEAKNSEIAQLRYDRSSGTISYYRSIKGPLIFPNDVDVDIYDVLNNGASNYSIWVADRGLRSIVCLDANGSERFRISQYTDNGVTYPLTNVKRIYSRWEIDNTIAFIDVNRNAFVLLSVSDAGSSSTQSVIIFPSPSKLMDIVFGYEGFYVIDKNLNQIHSIAFTGVYLGSFSRFSSDHAASPGLFSDIAGTALLNNPQSVSVTRYISNGSIIEIGDFGVANSWQANSGFIRLLPGADILNLSWEPLSINGSIGNAMCYFDLTNGSLISAKIYNSSGQVVRSWDPDGCYPGNYGYLAIGLGYGTYTITLSVTPFGNSGYYNAGTINNYQQTPLEKSYQFTLTAPSVSGKVIYANTAVPPNPIGAVAITLTPSTGPALTATSNATNGTYTIANVSAGTYTLTAAKTGTWGGVNATDALLVANHFARTALLTGLNLSAGDVNKTSAVNNTDAFLIARRYAGYSTSFPTGDWVFSSQQVSVGTDNVAVPDVTGLTVGDVNASYTLGTGIPFPKLAPISLKNGIDKFTISASSSEALGAVSIKIKVESAKVASISSKLPGFMSRVDDAGLTFAWFAADGKTPVRFDANEAIATVTLAEKADDGSNVTIESELADINGAVVNNNLAVSVLENIPTVFELKQNYPNPFNPSTQIDYGLPQPGMVTLIVYNINGQEVAKLVNEQKNAGSYSVQWAPKNLASGVYLYRIRVQTEKETITAVKRLTLLK